MFILGSTIEYNKSQILYPVNVTCDYADYTILNSDNEDVTSQKYLPAGTYTISVDNTDFGMTINGVYTSESTATLNIDRPFTIVVDSLTPTESLVYTLSDDGTYYIVGTGFHNIWEIKHSTSTPSTGATGLDNTWQGGDLIIPNTYNGKPVKAIVPYAFGEVNNITTVTIANGVSVIGHRCFQVPTTSANFPDVVMTDYRLPNDLEFLGGDKDLKYDVLTSLRLGTNNTPLSIRAVMGTNVSVDNKGSGTGRVFWGRSSLNQIKIPKCFNNIPQSTFAYCGFTSITLPSHIISVGPYAFQYNNISVINIHKDVEFCSDYAFEYNDVVDVLIENGSKLSNFNAYIHNKTAPATYNDYTLFTNFHSEDGIHYLGTANNPYLILINGSQATNFDGVIKNGVQVIGYKAFYDTGISQLTLPNTVLGIGEYAFYNHNISSITLPNNIKAIGEEAFEPSGGITSVVTNIPESIEYLGINIFGNHPSAKCLVTQRDISLPNIYCIYGNVFSYQTQIESVNIISNHISYLYSTFEYCTNLEELHLSESIKVLYGVCLSCNSLSTVNLENVDDMVGGLTPAVLSSVTLSNKLRIIAMSTFYGDSNLTSIRIPASVERINYAAFENTSLTSAIFEDPYQWFIASSASATLGTNLNANDLSNTATAATYLTNTYRRYYWNKGVYA